MLSEVEEKDEPMYPRQPIMHRQIMRAGKGIEIDHIDGNGLNNCKSNLRLCTRQDNAKNRNKPRGCSSRFKGVSYRKDSDQWSVSIGLKNRRISLGRFDSEIEAAKAYEQDLAAKKHHGKFAKLNLEHS